MDPNLANSILANVDSRIYEILQTHIPSNSFEAWTQAQEQVEGQLAIASTVVESATDVPDLVIATKMFWRGKDEGWPDWKQIIGCPAEVLKTHPWYRSTDPLPSTNAAHDVLSSNNDPAPPSDIADVRDAQPGWTSINAVNERDEAPIVATRGKGKQREDSVSCPKQDAPCFPSETHRFEQTSAAPSQSGSLTLLRDAGDEDTTMGEIASEEEDELEEEPERGRSTTRGTSTTNRRGNARSKSRGRQGMFPTCSPGSQIAGACGSCRTSNYLCSLSQSGGSCIQCKTRRKKCDYAGPRGPPRAKSRIHTQQRSPSPPLHPPPSKKRRAQPHLRRSASPAKACSSIQQRRSPTPIPTKRRRASSRLTVKNNARSTLEESQRLPTIIIPPLRNRATVAPEIKSGGFPAPAADDSEERPIIPLPTRGRSHRSANRAVEPAELGVTLGKTYNIRGDPLVTREEHQEMQRQFMAMKAENDWIKSELNNAYTLIRDMQANILSLRGTVEATRLFSMGSGEQHPDQRLSSSLNIAAEISQGSAPHSLPSNVANLASEERDSMPPIETLAIGIKETETDPFPSANPGEINPVGKGVSDSDGGSEEGNNWDPPDSTSFANGMEGMDHLADNAGI